jgi:hypothetical protein
MKMIFLLLPFLFFSACTSVKCTLETSGAETVSAAFIKALDCRNTAAVKRDVLEKVQKLHLCDKDSDSSRKVLSDGICEGAGVVVPQIVSSAIPAEWDCHPSSPDASLPQIVTAVCKFIP